MLRGLPTLNALKSFEAAARHESFTRAALELCVTQGAVSHQVKALEATLGVKLFNRERQRLAITRAGSEYLTVVRDAFDRIALGTERLLQRQNSGVLTLSTSPDFAAKWLVNRLGRFVEAHPEIDLRIAAQMHHVDFAREDVDLAVRHGDGNWPGLAAVNLCPEELFAVASPTLRAGIDRPADILKFPLLHYNDHGDWSKWLLAADLAGRDAIHGPVFNHASMLIDAAVNGQGVALARTSLATWDLLNGRLARLPYITLPVSRLYWIVCPQAVSTIPKIVTFREWLRAEAAADLRLLRAADASAASNGFEDLAGPRHPSIAFSEIPAGPEKNSGQPDKTSVAGMQRPGASIRVRPGGAS